MSHEIIKQPNGLFAVWSTVVDNFIIMDATPEELIEEEVRDARDKITKEIVDIVYKLNTTGHYWYFRSWEEAQEDLKEKEVQALQ